MTVVGAHGVKPDGGGFNSGNCGNTYIEVDSSGDYGVASVYVALAPATSAISYASVDVSWENFDSDQSSGSFVLYGGPVNPPTTYWDDTTDVATDPGLVQMTVTGSVRLSNGTTCTIIPTSASEQIS